MFLFTECSLIFILQSWIFIINKEMCFDEIFNVFIINRILKSIYNNIISYYDVADLHPTNSTMFKFLYLIEVYLHRKYFLISFTWAQLEFVRNIFFIHPPIHSTIHPSIPSAFPSLFIHNHLTKAYVTERFCCEAPNGVQVLTRKFQSLSSFFLHSLMYPSIIHLSKSGATHTNELLL